MKTKYIILVTLTIFIVVIDQLTKILIDSKMLLHQSIPVIDNFFNITYIRNSGAAFGMFTDAHPMLKKPLLVFIPIIALGLILGYFVKLGENNRFQEIALSCIFGGAVGNIIDRIRYEYVIDFLDFYYKSYHWPAFNVADSMISIGVGILIYTMILEEREKKLKKLLNS